MDEWSAPDEGDWMGRIESIEEENLRHWRYVASAAQPTLLATAVAAI